jgi:tryptophan synthase beta subunit
MGADDVQRQSLNVFRMKMCAARVARARARTRAPESRRPDPAPRPH